MMLAESLSPVPSPQAVSQIWIVISSGLGVLACGVAIVTSIIMVSTNKKQRREVTFGLEPASKADFEKHLAENKRDFDLLHTKVGSSERETRRQADEKVTRLSDDITKVSLQVAGIAATNEVQSQQLSVINSDIKKILVALPKSHGGHRE